jgi:hypothetical protein
MAVRSVQIAEEKLLAVVRWLVEEAGADTKLCDGEGRTTAELAHLTKKFAVESYLPAAKGEGSAGRCRCERLVDRITTGEGQRRGEL